MRLSPEEALQLLQLCQVMLGGLRWKQPALGYFVNVNPRVPYKVELLNFETRGERRIDWAVLIEGNGVPLTWREFYDKYVFHRA